jgi:hypothetical protein
LGDVDGDNGGDAEVAVSNSPAASAKSLSPPLAVRTLDPPSRRANADARASKRLFIGRRRV